MLGVTAFFLELGALVAGLALMARLANRVGFSPIPFYLLVGLGLSLFQLVPHGLTEEFIELGAEIGVILLLFMLGLEYTSEELRLGMRQSVAPGVADILINFTPGLIVGLLLDWTPIAALLLGGVTYISSSGVIAKVLNDLDWLGNRETPTVLSLLVFEDLVMAVYLPLVVVLIVGNGFISGLISLAAALATVAIVLICALNYGERISRVIAHRSNEVVLLTTLGLVLLIAGLAQQMQVSAAVGAFLVGIGLSGPVAAHARELLTPLRDLFAATFFLFFGLQIDPSAVPPVLGVAIGLGVVTAMTKIATGWWAARRAGVATPGRFRAGAALVARGEFSIVIAGLGAGLTPQLAPLAAAYVLLMAIAGPVLTRGVDPVVTAIFRNRTTPTETSAVGR